MHKTLITTLFIFVCALYSNAQIYSAEDLQPDTAFTNIHVKKLHSDERSTVFVIWVKEEVKAHRHDKHTEVVFVLEGKGKMKLGKDKRKIRKGDTVIIPQGTAHSVVTKSKKPLKVISVQAPIFTGEDRVWIK